MLNLRFSNGAWLRLPERIEEMDQVQFLTFARLVWQWKQGQIDQAEFRLRLVMSLAGLKLSRGYFHHSHPAELERIHADLALMAALTDCLFETTQGPDGPHKALRLSFSGAPIDRHLRLQGPGELFERMSFEEFTHALNYHSQYLQSQDEADLNRLVAVLFRPRRRWLPLRRLRAGGVVPERVPFRVEDVEERARWFAALDIGFRFGALLWYEASMEQLRNLRFPLGGTQIDLSRLFSRTGDGEREGIGLLGVLFDLAADGLFGNAKQTGEQNLYDVLTRLYQLIDRADRMKKPKGND